MGNEGKLRKKGQPAKVFVKGGGTDVLIHLGPRGRKKKNP